MDVENPNDQQQSKSVSCTRLPEALMDKQAAKAFFGKFGTIKRFILRPKRNECTVEYETVEAAQQAQSHQGNFQIFPTPMKAPTPEPDYFIDPDVQSELDVMQPVGMRSQAKQAIETFMRNPNSMAKSRMPVPPRFKSEPLSVSVSDPRLISAAKIELESLARKPARSAEEKLKVLDTRDKLYRLVNAKSNDISKATSTKGTCKDMCPEKERLMREARLQVASFELSDRDSSMDQKKAIKQYSRSAADAETPLPHELRPESSLKTAMTYMLHNIMNLCDDDNTSIGDWFHFVWDRTRGIRKDITQQELCSPLTVELVEQCVRFHIHCSARLIAEDPSTFDQKINTENLTKCLQTLKYMYNDLKLKNIKCPNEAEFRAYVVLLNLNESGNFLWEIKELEKNLLNSKEVRFALDVYFAVSNNNYVKFFNLARESSYMSSCLLLRYFTQVRMKAINIIMHSYTPRKVGFNYNISYLTEILAFEDEESTITFLTHHGLMCDVDADIVLLDRTMFGVADTPYQMDRALQMVESKMETSVAEAVCGGPLPSPDCFLKIVPHVSFDQNGFLKQESFYAEDQNGPSPFVSKESVFKVPRDSPPVSPMSRPKKSDQLDGGSTENLFYKSPTSVFPSAKPTLQQAAKNVFKPDAKPANPFASKMSFGSPQNQTTTNSIFGAPAANATPTFSVSKPTMQKHDSVFSLPKLSSQEPTIPASSVFGSIQFGTPQNKDLFSFAKQVEQVPSFSFKTPEQENQDFEKNRRNQEAAEKLRLEEDKKAREKAEKEEQMRLNREIEEMQLLEAERLRLEEEIKKLAEHERAVQEACDNYLGSLIDDAVNEKVKTESQHAVALFVKLPADFYDALEHDIAVDEVYKIYRQEFLAYVNQTKLKYEMMIRCFKQWRNTAVHEIKRREKLSTIGCSILNSSLEQQAGNLHHPQQSAALSNMKQYLSGSPQQILVPDFNKFPMIDLFDDLKVKSLDIGAKIFWKFLISIPIKNEEKCSGFSSYINKWLIKSFGDMTQSDGALHINEKVMRSSKKLMGICIRKLQGAEMINEKGQKSPSSVQHSHGILFLTSSANLQASRKRLQNILDKLELPVAVSVIVYKNQVGSNDEDELRRHMDLTMEVNVSSFEINLFYECHEKEKDLKQVVLDSCQFLSDSHMDCLIKNDLKLFDLQMQHVLDFFQITIGDEMWRRVELSCRQSDKFRSHMSEFNCVVQLHNECLHKLMQVVTNNFSKMPSIPEEFRRRLPPIDQRIPNGYEYFPEDWKSSHHPNKLISFIHDLKLVKMPDDNFKSFDDFKSKIMAFLNSNINTNKDKVFQAIISKVIDYLYRKNLVSDDEILEALRKFCWLNVLGEIIVAKFNEVYERNQQIPLAVVYYKKDLQGYKGVPWWYSMEFESSDRNEEPINKKQKLTQPTKDEIEMMLMKSSTSLNKLSHKIESFKEVSSKTREVSKDFDKHLFNFEESFRGKMQTWTEKFND